MPSGGNRCGREERRQDGHSLCAESGETPVKEWAELTEDWGHEDCEVCGEARRFDAAAQFARRAHGAQIRKYTGEAYVNHCLAVARTVAAYTDRPEPVIAAVLHDTLEDTSTTEREISTAFGPEVLELVLEVTDRSTPADGNREARKAIDRAHLARASADGKTIKLADLLDNLGSIAAHDPSFSRVYLDEMAQLLPLLQGGHPALYDRAAAALRSAEEALLQAALAKGSGDQCTTLNS